MKHYLPPFLITAVGGGALAFLLDWRMSAAMLVLVAVVFAVEAWAAWMERSR